MIKMLKSCIKRENKKFRKEQRERIKNIVSLKQINSHDDVPSLEMMNIEIDEVNNESKNNVHLLYDVFNSRF